MTILEKTGQTYSITEGRRALDLFTDRVHLIRLFSFYLNDDTPRENILFFYGDGGNGKSLLIRFLREYCCKLLSPEDWERAQKLSDDELVLHIKNIDSFIPVPSALLDFGLQPRGEDDAKQAFSALLMLRRALAGHKLQFPTFGFACVWYLYKTNKLSEAQLANLFPAEEMDLVTGIIDAITGTSLGALGKAVIGVFAKHLRERFTLFKQRLKLDESRIAEIERMDPEKQLIDHLPRLFAEDLNASMTLDKAPRRIVLFFDTHEAFWGTERSLSEGAFFQRDEWLRHLLASLELSSGIVAVIAGRDRPQWPEASRFKIPHSYLDKQLVNHLPEPDADQYLQRSGISDVTMRRSLIAYTQVEPGQVHPLYLGLCADVVLAATERNSALSTDDFRITSSFIDRGAELMRRLMQYVNEEVGFAVRALSACRAFNREIYFMLGKALNFLSTEPSFLTLTRFSFVRGLQQGEDWYRIHELIQGQAHQQQDTVVIQAHQILERYYSQQAEAGDKTGRAEAIYHRNRIDWERGADEWIEAFESALVVSDYQLCAALLSVSGELQINSDFKRGRILQSLGDYFKSLARYDEAMQEYLEANAVYDQMLSCTPNSIDANHNKGIVFSKIGNLQAELSQHQEAVGSFLAAIASLDVVLRYNSDFVAAYNHKGIALASLGDSQAELSQHREAASSFKTAIASLNEVLRRNPDDIASYNNKGIALSSLGDTQSILSQYQDALLSYKQAVVVFDEAVMRNPDHIATYNNKGIALRSLADLQANLSQHEDALNTYADSLAAFDQALIRAQDDIAVYNNKGLAFAKLGILQIIAVLNCVRLLRLTLPCNDCAFTLAQVAYTCKSL